MGIDPGPTETATVLWNGSRVQEPQIIPSSEVVGYIEKRHGAVVGVACEHLECFGMTVGRPVFETAYMVGEIRRECAILDIPFYRVYRTEEKMHLCHSRRAEDKNIRRALLDRFGEVGTKKNPGPLYGIATHLWSALAIAVYQWDSLFDPSQLYK